tara:strand:- start:114 stop:944 length:831 start_codon:yes stop_codon:yes gene_type:complete
MALGIISFSESPISSLGKQDAVAVVTGQSIGTLTAGTVVASWSHTIAVSGNPLDIVLGTESVVANTIATPSGEEITSTVGNVTVEAIANPTVSVSALNELTTNIGVYAVTAGGAVEINAAEEPDMDLFTGTPVVVANANVSVTGQSIGTLTTGTATVEAITLVPVSTNLVETFMEDVTVQATGAVQVTGQSIGTLTAGTTTVVASSTALPTGNIISSTLADVTPIQTAKPEPTGLSVSIALADSTAVYAWTEVDDSETSTWTEVDDSATMTWQDAA